MLLIPCPPGNADYPALLSDLHAIVDVGELLVEDFAVLHARYSRLHSQGFPFSPEFVLIMRILTSQAQASFEDSDNDTSVDDGQGMDEENEVPFGESRAA